MKLLSSRPRVLIGIGAGIAMGLGASYLLDSSMKAAILGALAAIAVGGLEDVKGCTIAGLCTGAVTGLVLAIMGRPFVAETGLPDGPLGTIAQVVATIMVVGMVCAGYGFIVARLKRLYDEGRGPFF